MNVDHPAIGKYVVKPKGYPWPGQVVGAFEYADGWLRFCVARFEADGSTGSVHIFAPSQVLEVPREAAVFAAKFGPTHEGVQSYLREAAEAGEG